MFLRKLLAALALLASCATAEAVEIETARGKVDIAATPKTVAVYDIAAVDTLDRLGVKLDGLPSKLYVPELSGLLDVAEPVGDIFEPDLEALNALAPDLVIIGGRSSPRLDAVSKVAPSIDMTMDGDDLLLQARQRLDAYGALFGREAEAKAVQAELDRSVEAARSAVAGKGKALIVMTNGPKISVYGPGSRFGWVHKALDLPAAVPDVAAASHGEAVSFEFIRAANPDWLLVLDRAAAIGSGEQNAKATLDNELVAQTAAWQKGQVIYLPSADFYIAAGGIQSTHRVLQKITEAFASAPPQ
ncbi:UNVERIFIED_ORG: siderophore ABC transporter substrate-binding protein (plasmid) [Roseateles sp. XES5]|nr:siderophore ABC transporter substrate-binding protein [Roseateles sp. XES5]